MSTSEDTSNACDDKDDLRMAYYNSLNEEQRNEYFTQKCFFLNELRKTNHFCDVTLVGANDVEINAHKLVLIGASQYFFTKFMKYNEDRLLLKHFDSSTLESLVHYAYTDEITINEDNIETILQAADYFCMEILKNDCCDFLSSTIALRNCLRIRSIADVYTCESLLNTCDDFIKKHFTEVVKDEKFLDFSLDGLSKMIQDDDLNVPSELTVYIAVMDWIKHDLKERQKHLYELLRYVRLPFLGRDRLSRIFRSEPLFTNISDEVQRLFLNAFEEENSLSASSLATTDGYVPIPRVSYSSIPKMFIIGGSGNGSNSSSSQMMVELFDIRSNVWRPTAQLNESVDGNSAVSTQNKVYVTGQQKMKIFDLKTGVWTGNVNMPVYRRYHASVLMNNKIYVIGGTDANNVALRSVEYYCLKENKWYNAPDMIEPRVYTTAAVLNGKICVVGGSTSLSPLEPSDTVELYEPATSTWNSCKNMHYGRYGAAVCVADDFLFVVGGKDGGNFGDRFEMYLPLKDEWKLMPNLRVPRMCHGVCYDNGYFFVAGGKWNDVCVSSIDVFCSFSRKWYEMGIGLNVARSSAAVVMAYESPN